MSREQLPSKELWTLIEAFAECRADVARHPTSESSKAYMELARSNLDDTLQAALSTPAEPRTVEPLTKSEVNACWDGLMPGGHGKSRYDIAALLSDAFAAKNGLVLAGGEG